MECGCCDSGEILRTMYNHWQKQYMEMSCEDLEELFVSQDFECFEDSEIFLNICINRFLAGEDLGNKFFDFLRIKASKAYLEIWIKEAKTQQSKADSSYPHDLGGTHTNEIITLKNHGQTLEKECERILKEKFPNKVKDAIYVAVNQLCEDVLPLLPR